MKAHEVHLVKRPQVRVEEENFALVTVELPGLSADQVLVRNQVVSVDPGTRASLNGRSFTFPLNEVFGGGAVGEVVHSTARELPVGTMVLSNSGWRDYAILSARDVRVLNSADVEPSAYVGMYGMPGHTAWAALRRVAPPHSGQTVLVTAAGGAVGVVAVQLALATGCRVVASLGSEVNARYLREELGVTATINYRDVDVVDQLKNAAPGGVDVFLDNTGGRMFGIGFRAMALWGRIVICGSMSDLDGEGDASLSFDPFMIRSRRLTISSVIVSDYQDAEDDFREEIRNLMATGRVRNVESRAYGLGNVAATYVNLFRTSHLGKMVVLLDDPAV